MLVVVVNPGGISSTYYNANTHFIKTINFVLSLSG